MGQHTSPTAELLLSRTCSANSMRTLQEKITVLSVFLTLICVIQVDSLPIPEDWNSLIQRTKRSLLWRWNSMKPVGASCRDHLECGTKYCRRNICSFWSTN